MEDDVGLVALEDLAHLRPVADVGQHRDARREAALGDELALDLEQRRLGVVDQDQPLRPTRAIWRQSSEPIEPPAPVTSTVARARYEAIAARSTSTGSRPSTSSTCTGRIWPARSRSPEISS